MCRILTHILVQIALLLFEREIIPMHIEEFTPVVYVTFLSHIVILK